MSYDVRSVSTISGTGTSVTLSLPAGAVNTDGIYAFFVHQAGTTLTPATDWVFVASVFVIDTTVRVMQFNGNISAAPWTFLLGSSNAYAAAIVAVQADTAPGATRPVPDVSATKTQASTLTPAVTPTVTPGNTGDLLLSIIGVGRGTTFAAPGGTTEQVDVKSGNTATDKTLWIGSAVGATTAGVPTSAISVTNNNPNGLAADEYGIVTLALKSVPPPTTWAGDFETGDFSQYAFYQGADASRITIQTDTPRQGTKYARFTALDDDVFPLTPTENPRAQLVGPRYLFPGTERWITWSTRFPSSLPVINQPGFFVFFQYHGPPYVGSPSVGFGVTGSFVNIERNVSYDYDTIWETPILFDTWMDFVMRINLAQDTTGFIELWLNGKQQTFRPSSGATRRLYMRTVEPDQNGGLEIDPTLYRQKGMFSTATLDHDAVRFDPTTPAALAAGAQITSPVRGFSSGTSSPTTRARVVG